MYANKFIYFSKNNASALTFNYQNDEIIRNSLVKM